MADVRLSKTASKNLVAKMYAKGWGEGGLAEESDLSIRTVKSAIAGKPVNLATIFKIERALGVEPSTFMQMDASTESVPSISAEKGSLFEKWHPLFLNTLQSKLSLSSNEITSFDGLCFDRRAVYVPLSLSKRSRQPRYLSTTSLHSKRLATLDHPIYPAIHEESLEQALNSFLAEDSKKARIALFGPVGIGKTTLLQAIVDFVAGCPHYGFVIWVSSEDFLKSPTHLDPLNQLISLVPAHATMPGTDWEELRSLFSQSEVWIILDGIDEIGFVNDRRFNRNLYDCFQRLKQRMLELSKVAHVVVSCQSTSWNVASNPLREDFNAYELMGFKLGKDGDLRQLGQAITKLFPSKSAKRLKQVLQHQPHLKSLLSNPFSLLLLRFTWHIWQDLADLPMSNAELCLSFIDHLYDRYPGTKFDNAQRKQLNYVAGVLAQWTIECYKSPSRLARRAIHEILEYKNISLDFFNQLVEVGILKRFGVDYEDPKEEVYGFPHAIFRDHFAAFSVASDNWPFFFNPKPKSPADESFRAQDIQWRDAILIWFGRKDVSSLHKEAFLNALINFEDECGGFYYCRTYCLVTAATRQYQMFSRKDEVIRRVTAWSFGFNSIHSQELCFVPDRVKRQAARAMLEADPHGVKQYADRLLAANADEDARLTIALELGQSELFSETASRVLFDLAINSSDSLIVYEAVNGLISLRDYDLEAAQSIVSNLEFRLNSSTGLPDQWLIVNALVAIDPKNPSIVSSLADLIATNAGEKNDNSKEIAEVGGILFEIPEDSSTTSQDCSAIQSHQIAHLLYQVDPNHPLAVKLSAVRQPQQQRKTQYTPELLDVLLSKVEQAMAKQQSWKVERLVHQIIYTVLNMEKHLLLVLWADRHLRLFRILKKWSVDECSSDNEVCISPTLVGEALQRCSEDLPYTTFRWAWRKCDTNWVSLLD